MFDRVGLDYHRGMALKLAIVSVIDAVTDDLRGRVLSGRIEPGAPLVEVEVAEAYDVARPTAKAAIENLVRERLLERSAHKTARVVRLTTDDVRDIYRTREIVESEVLRRLAAAREVPEAARAANADIAALEGGSPQEVVEPDMRFHRSLIAAVGSERVSRLYDSLASEVVFCMSQVQGAALLPTSVIAAEHERLLHLIEAGDGDGAAELLTVHLGRARERLVGRLGGVAGPEGALPFGVMED